MILSIQYRKINEHEYIVKSDPHSILYAFRVMIYIYDDLIMFYKMVESNNKHLL